MSTADFARVVVGDREFDTWLNYRITSSLETPSDRFNMTVGVGRATKEQRAELRSVLAEGQPVKVYVGWDVTAPRSRRFLQMTGVIDTLGMKGDRAGTAITITGRDLAAHVVDSSAPLNALQEDGTAFVDLVVALLEPWGIDVSTDAAAARDVLTGLSAEQTQANRRAARRQARQEARQSRLEALASLPAVGTPEWGGFESGTENQVAQIQSAAAAAKVARQRELFDVRLAEQYGGLSPGGAARRRRRIANAERVGHANIPIDIAEAAHQITPADAREFRAHVRAGSRRANNMVESDIASLKVKQAKPQAGETVWQFIERHAKRLGLMMWMAPTGMLIIGAPDYSTAPLQRLIRRIENDPEDPNTILSGGAKFNAADRYSVVTVYGRARGGDALRSAVVAEVTDASLPYYRPLVVHDNGIRSTEDAERRALRELNEYKAKAEILTYTMPQHGQGNYLYAIDTQVTVVDEVADIEGIYYVTSRSFTKDRKAGTVTELTLVPSGAITI